MDIYEPHIEINPELNDSSPEKNRKEVLACGFVYRHPAVVDGTIIDVDNLSNASKYIFRSKVSFSQTELKLLQQQLIERERKYHSAQAEEIIKKNRRQYTL